MIPGFVHYLETLCRTEHSRLSFPVDASNLAVRQEAEKRLSSLKKGLAMAVVCRPVRRPTSLDVASDLEGFLSYSCVFCDFH
jgi:hypothetical protein